MLYITNSIQWSRLCKRDQITYDHLKELTKNSEGLSDAEVQHLMVPTLPTPQDGPEQFDISDDENIEPHTQVSVPEYDLTDDKFNVLRGMVDQDHIYRLRECFTKAVKLGAHLQAQPNDNDAKGEHEFYKETLARKIAEIRYDKNPRTGYHLFEIAR